jgi:hypothetical protein
MPARFLGLLLALCLLSACGVPPAALDFARTQNARALATPNDDASVRAALASQADAWQQFAAALRQRTFGGLTPPDAPYLALVDRTAAIAARQRTLQQLQRDDPALNRQLLNQFAQRWQQAATYLQQ